MSKTNPLEAAFAIGRPAQDAAHKTCSRCKGTGWWQLGRKCFACGGAGNLEIVTGAVKLRNKRAHIEEVRGMISDDTARLPTMRFGRKQAEESIARRAAQLAQLEGELAQLGGAK